MANVTLPRNPVVDDTGIVVPVRAPRRADGDPPARGSEERYRRLVRDLAVGVQVYGPLADVRMSNQAALDLLGLTEAELADRSAFDPDRNVVHEDGSAFSGASHPVLRCIAAGRAVRGVVMGVFRPRSRDRVWLLVDALPQFGARGQVVEVVCTLVDITRRKQVEAALAAREVAVRPAARSLDPTVQAAAQARAVQENDLRRGLDRHELVLFYQVQVDAEGNPIGAEALLRWRHPSRGLVLPAEIIALAEHTGMILELGRWVLETACEQLARWADEPGMRHWSLAVNVSATQFAHADFVGNVFGALRLAGARPERLVLELTESSLAVDIEDIIFKMTAIKVRGVSFSLDDFGTGYSSLSYLKRLPLSQLKIDRSFVRDILSDSNDAAIARTILALGHTLGLAVISEGVETVEQLELLTDMGCDAFQGYLFGRPTPRLDALGAMVPAPVCH